MKPTLRAREVGREREQGESFCERVMGDKAGLVHLYSTM